MQNKSIFSKYSYAWVTAAFFLFSMFGHWLFGWQSFIQQQTEHNQPIEMQNYLNEMLRDTFENWQSEFLQLIWQVGGLAVLFYVGSPQSKEGDDRKEEKLDLILKKLDGKNAEKDIKELDKKYPKQ